MRRIRLFSYLLFLSIFVIGFFVAKEYGRDELKGEKTETLLAPPHHFHPYVCVCYYIMIHFFFFFVLFFYPLGDTPSYFFFFFFFFAFSDIWDVKYDRYYYYYLVIKGRPAKEKIECHVEMKQGKNNYSQKKKRNLLANNIPISGTRVIISFMFILVIDPPLYV